MQINIKYMGLDAEIEKFDGLTACQTDRPGLTLIEFIF